MYQGNHFMWGEICGIFYIVFSSPNCISGSPLLIELVTVQDILWLQPSEGVHIQLYHHTFTLHICHFCPYSECFSAAWLSEMRNIPLYYQELRNNFFCQELQVTIRPSTTKYCDRTLQFRCQQTAPKNVGISWTGRTTPLPTCELHESLE